MAADRIVELQTWADRETQRKQAEQARVEAVPVGLSDDELALRFSERHGVLARYVALWDRWLLWDDKRFAHDTCRRIFDMARAVCREVLAEHLRDDPAHGQPAQSAARPPRLCSDYLGRGKARRQRPSPRDIAGPAPAQPQALVNECAGRTSLFLHTGQE